MQQLRLNKNWRLEQKGQELYIIGGQDAIFTIELETTEESFFTKLKPGQQFTDKLKDQDKVVLEQLLSAEVVQPVLKTQVKKLAVCFIGKKEITKQFETSHNFDIKPTAKADLLIFIKANESFDKFLRDYDYMSVRQPHLLLDLAYHHTISIGPLVFPGVTACLACLKGRIKTRWGDDEPPIVPKVSQDLVGFANEWLKLELAKLITDEDYSLVNKTVVFDTQDRVISPNKLLTVPLCPYCKKSKLLSDGKLSYTFFKA